VYLAFQSHFRILARAGLLLMPDFTREHGGLRSTTLSKVAIGELNERFGVLFVTDSLRSRKSPPE
jgi:hypothetical protein